MTHVNKKLVHEYVNEWFNYIKNWVNTNDWENDVFMAIAQWYYENEFEMNSTDTQARRDKLFTLIKNDSLYVKNYKQWWLKNSLNKIKKDF